VSRSQSFSKKLPLPFSTPNSSGSCPTTMVRASPMMKPLRTGSEMKLARKPRRRSPATRARNPVVMARAVVWARNPALLGVATSATAAADRAAVADIGPVTRCRELPKAAYSSSAPGAAYSPTTGDTPAIEA
jgi:hypothetical protein